MRSDNGAGHVCRIGRMNGTLLYLPLSCLVLLTSLLSLSCNTPFQPETQFTPRLVVYSVLFGNSHSVYVRVGAVTRNGSSAATDPVHGATVYISGAGMSQDTARCYLVDTTSVMDGDTVSYYLAHYLVQPYGIYVVNVEKDGYPSAGAVVRVPGSFVTAPDLQTYNRMRRPGGTTDNLQLTVNLSAGTAAEFVRFYLEYRGFDSLGNFQSGYLNVSVPPSPDPFTEVATTQLTYTVNIYDYAAVFKSLEGIAGTLRQSHIYACIVVTQVDDALYRFYMTSNRGLDPLGMRTDKIIFSNLFTSSGTGVGVVGGATVDTTRMFLN